MIIKTLQEIDFSVIHKAFSKAFVDYELPPMSLNQLKQMVTRRGFSPEISFGAFYNNELVSLTLNGSGNWNGKLTAYDTGTGTIKEYRKKGLAKQIFKESIPVLKKAGISQYLLEVLQHNEKAINLYKNAGFQVTREFDYYIANKKDINFANKKNSIGIKIKKIDIPSHQIAQTFWDFEPSWQNSFDSVYRTVHNFEMLGAFSNNTLVGYGITELNTGDITQFAINKNFRRKGIATYLFYHLIGYIPGDTVKIINTEKKDVSMNFFLESLNIQPAGSQFEMIKAL